MICLIFNISVLPDIRCHSIQWMKMHNLTAFKCTVWCQCPSSQGYKYVSDLSLQSSEGMTTDAKKPQPVP